MPPLFQANKKGPEFPTTYNNTEQQVIIHFTALEVLLHLEAILSIIEFAQALVPPPSPAKENIGAEIVPMVESQTQVALPGKGSTVASSGSAIKEEIAEQRREWF